jgi:putative ABC transport system substrate-binding protein
MIDRRHFVLAMTGAAAAVARSLRAQPAQRVYRVANLYSAPAYSASFLERLEALGYRQGHNLQYEVSNTDVPLDRLPGLAKEMAAHHPDVMCAGGGAFVFDALKRAAGTTPIVMLFIDYDPEAKGSVASLRQPGGNVTGLYLRTVELAPKKLELLKEAVPSAKRIAVLFDDSSKDQLQLAQSAAKSLGVVLLPKELRGDAYDYESALLASVRDKADAVLILSSGAFVMGRFTMMAAVQKYRLPSMATPAFRDAGAMLCYGADFFEMWRRLADFVDLVLRGANPANMAIEQPTKIEYIVNLKTAQALGVKLPDATLQRASDKIS